MDEDEDDVWIRSEHAVSVDKLQPAHSVPRQHLREGGHEVSPQGTQDSGVVSTVKNGCC